MSDAEALAPFVKMALDGVHRAYPYHLSLVVHGPDDLRLPRELTPVFYGCFDWHSAVHGHWLLARAARLFPDAAFAADALRALETSFDAAALEAERKHLAARPGFERPYGLAWLLQLHAELLRWRPEWAARLEPLAELASAHLCAWLPKLSHPNRVGTHAQTAFALGLALDWARDAEREEVRELLVERANALHGQDRDFALNLEPSGEDFLSPALGAADLMRRVLSRGDFARWLDQALPEDLPLAPVRVTDATDGRLAHLDGLNLSRAWMLDGILDALEPTDARRSWRAIRDLHASRGLAAIDGAHYAGSHWLGSFAAYLLTRRGVIAG